MWQSNHGASLRDPMVGDVESSHGNPESLGTVYQFTPTMEHPKLRLCTDKRPDAPLKAIIRRKAVLIVKERCPGQWFYVRCNGFSGWAYISDASIESGAFKKVISMRRYENWLGNNYFFFQGRFMVGSDARMLMITNIMLVVPTAIFMAFTATKFERPVIVNVVVAVLLVFILINLWTTALTEPGIIPRRDLAEHAR
jgi:hypothetical protein